MSKEKKRHKAVKGSFGYIRTKKRSYTIKVFTILAVALLIFVIGYYLNKKTTSNVFTILAVLLVLPGAKALTALIVFMPYKTVEATRYHALYERIQSFHTDICSEDEAKKTTVFLPQKLNVLTDVVLTSSEKVMNLDFLVISDSIVIGLVGKEKQDLSYIQKYLKEGMMNKGFTHRVKMFQDEDPFFKMIDRSIPKVEEGEVTDLVLADRLELMSYLTSLIVE